VLPYVYLPSFQLIETDLALFNHKPLGPSTASDAAVNVALNWVKNCSSKHKDCHSVSRFLPTRLIDVGSGPNPVVRLALREDVPLTSRYLTLSHCWGDRIPERLLSGNFETVRKEIKLNSLSKTFQEAIIFTRKLSCQYIWIDSLCIIQDDLVDWQKESAQMREVYRSSACNISASDAKDGSQGLFRSRDSLVNESNRLRLKLGHEPYDGLYPIWDTAAWFDNVERCPLNSRGWVCQERFLSSSNLHFTSGELFWECRKLTACETFPRGFPQRLIEDDDETSIKKLLYQNVENRESEVVEQNRTWNTLLRNYTASKVTFARDKLVAFSGLAAMWGENINDEYFAGLWRSRLPRDLLWHTLHPRTDYEHQEYVAPSWSWASMDGEVVFEDPARGFVAEVDIISANTELLSVVNQFGQVNYGFLCLRSWLAIGYYDTEIQDGLSLQTSDLSFEKVSNNLEVFWDRPRPRRMYWGNLSDSHQIRVPIYFFPICTWFGFGRERGTQGLVLRHAESNSVGFVRLGMFQAYAGGIEMVSQACRYFDTLPESTKLDRSKDGKGRVKYTIILV
jgi:hypothetical protein